jgi:hypothetical protein
MHEYVNAHARIHVYIRTFVHAYSLYMDCTPLRNIHTYMQSHMHTIRAVAYSWLRRNRHGRCVFVYVYPTLSLYCLHVCTYVAACMYVCMYACMLM